MQKYMRLAKHLTQEFNRVEFTQVPRSQNMGAGKIAKQTSSEVGATSIDLKIEVYKHPSIKEVFTFTIQSESIWMTLILSFLQDGQLPHDVEEAKKLKKRATRFTILNDALYKRDISMPYLKCIDEEEAKYILEEIHKGIYGDYAGPRSLVSKAIRIGYFQPTLQKDARVFIKRCNKCQKFGNV